MLNISYKTKQNEKNNKSICYTNNNLCIKQARPRHNDCQTFHEGREDFNELTT